VTGSRWLFGKALFAVCLLLAGGTSAQMRGHGGPVRAIVVTPDSRTAVSGSFDESAIVWSLEEGAARQVFRFHDGAVNAVALVGDGAFLTAGEDGRIALWRRSAIAPERVIDSHRGPIVALAVSSDRSLVASASWDGTARVTRLDDGAAVRVLEGHQGNVNGVAFLPDGGLVTAGYDATLRIWPAEPDGVPLVRTFPTALNGLAVAPDGEIVVAGADGAVRMLRPDGTERAQVQVSPSPAIALALSPDGKRVAAATIGGGVAVIELGSAVVALTLVGPGLPVWSVAFTPDGNELVTGGGDRMVRRWSTLTGEPIGALAMARPGDELAGFNGDRGAQVFRACVACHTLTPDQGNRAGPTLHGVFGRRIATLPGYNFSPPLKALDIVWTPETVSTLFEVGPARYTPGTKMPEQTISDPADREALVRFLDRVTR
jgi:cytochrome c